MRCLATLCFAIAVLWLAASPAGAVTIDGREWRQLTDTVNFSYDDFAVGYPYDGSVTPPCSTVTGACSGIATSAGGATVDVEGWTWASAADVIELFETLTGAPAGTFDTHPFNLQVTPGYTAWADAAIDTDGAGPDTGFFDFTDLDSNDDNFAITGLTRSKVSDSEANRSYIQSTPISDLAQTANPVTLDTARAHTGAWFYIVPEPSTGLMLGLGLALLGMRRAR